MPRIPEFKRSTTIPPLHTKLPAERFRESRHVRGYDSKWDTLSRWQLKTYPICAKCDAEGLDVPAAVADHIIPLRDGGARLDRANVWSLCGLCHNGWKRRLEEYARARGLTKRLIGWCRRLRTAPTV